MRSRIPALLGAIACLPLGAAAGQGLDSRTAWTGGLEFRSVSFQRTLRTARLRQVALPLGAEVAIGRLSFDAGTSWASTTLTRRDGTEHNVSSLTDTQVRASYMFGRDAVVASLVANLPTGPASSSARDFSVLGAVSPSFLGFPVPVYASGLSMVGGVAAAIEAGAWSIGLAGSVKISDEFTPYQDAAGVLTYRPGLEGRLRAGADGLIGASQLTIGLTWSTFGTDQFGAGGTTSGEYRPGTRLILEGGLLAPVGSSTLSLSLWNFYKATGDTSRISVANRESLAGGAASLMLPAGRRLTLEPRVEGRLLSPESGSGQLLGAGLGLRLDLSNTVTLHPTTRYEWGSFDDPDGLETSLRGWYTSVFIRVNY